MIKVLVKKTGTVLKVWSDNIEDRTYDCMEIDGDASYDVITTYRYDEVEIIDGSVVTRSVK